MKYDNSQAFKPPSQRTTRPSDSFMEKSAQRILVLIHPLVASWEPISAHQSLFVIATATAIGKVSHLGCSFLRRHLPLMRDIRDRRPVVEQDSPSRNYEKQQGKSQQ